MVVFFDQTQVLFHSGYSHSSDFIIWEPLHSFQSQHRLALVTFVMQLSHKVQQLARTPLRNSYFVQNIKNALFFFGSCHPSDGHCAATEIETTTTELHMLFGYQGIKRD